MRRFRFWPQMALVLAIAAMNGGCILIPKIKDRIVELAVAGATSATFTVSGSATSADETDVIDVGTALDLQGILDDAGIDVSQVTHIAVSGVSYRITRADADPTREVTGGTITFQREGSAAENLVTDFSAAPGSTSDFTNVTLGSNGVEAVNAMLSDILAALPGAPANPTATFHLTGNMTSTSGNPADFDVEVKITISVTGKITVSVPT
jgi:hypothetical protein